MSWILKIAVDKQKQSEDQLCSALWDVGSIGMATVEETIIAGFSTEAAALDAAEKLGLPHKVEQVDQTWQQPDFGPLEVQTPSGSTWLHLEAKQVFGHGHHPTTQLSLRLLEECLHRFDPDDLKNIALLDVGTGSGVLAIAAATFGVGTVCAIDIDPQAVAAATKNAKQNNVEISVSDNLIEDLEQSFDLIVCNVLLPVHRTLGKEILQKINHPGYLAISGILQDQIDEATQVYSSLVSCQTRTEDDWAGLLFQSTL